MNNAEQTCVSMASELRFSSLPPVLAKPLCFNAGKTTDIRRRRRLRVDPSVLVWRKHHTARLVAMRGYQGGDEKDFCSLVRDDGFVRLLDFTLLDRASATDCTQQMISVALQAYEDTVHPVRQTGLKSCSMNFLG